MSKFIAPLLMVFGTSAFAGSIQGKITITKVLEKKIAPTAVLYVIAREAGATGGMPLAVKRFTQPFKFPVNFVLGDQDAMMPGSQLPAKISINVRVAQTGSATPVNPGDLIGKRDAKAGETVTIAIDKVQN